MAAAATQQSKGYGEDAESPRLSNTHLQVWRPSEKFNVALSLESLPDDRVAFARSQTPDVRIGVSEQPVLPQWVERVMDQVRDLSTLKPGWDTYQGAPVKARVLESALTILSGIMPPSAPAPELVPTASGGIDVEWQIESADLSIQIRPYKDPIAYFSSADVEWEVPLGLRLLEIRQILSSMKA